MLPAPGAYDDDDVYSDMPDLIDDDHDYYLREIQLDLRRYWNVRSLFDGCTTLEAAIERLRVNQATVVECVAAGWEMAHQAVDGGVVCIVRTAAPVPDAELVATAREAASRAVAPRPWSGVDDSGSDSGSGIDIGRIEDDEDGNEQRLIRAKHLWDGCRTLRAFAVRSVVVSNALARLAQDGWGVAGVVEWGYMLLRRTQSLGGLAAVVEDDEDLEVSPHGVLVLVRQGAPDALEQLDDVHAAVPGGVGERLGQEEGLVAAADVLGVRSRDVPFEQRLVAPLVHHGGHQLR
jgi:hypothetical protein